MNKSLVNFMELLSSKALRAVINLLFTSFLARVLGPSGVGEWAMVIAAGTLLHSFLLNWMHAPTLRFGREEWVRYGSVTAIWAARFPLVIIGFFIAIILLIADPGHWLGRFFHLPENSNVSVFFALLWLWISVDAQNLLQIRGAIRSLAIAPVCVDGVLVISLLLVFAGIVGMVSSHVLIYCLLMLSVSLWGAVLLWQLWQFRFHWEMPTYETIKPVFAYGWPLVPGFLLGYTSDWGDQLLLGYFYTSHEVGLFQTAYQFMVLLLGVVGPLGTILLPRLIDKEVFSLNAPREFLVKAGPTLIMLGLILLVPVVTIAPLFFKFFFGEEFTEASSVFIVLIASIPGSIVSSLYGTYFNLQGRLLRSTVIYGGIMSAANIAFSILLLPRLGIIGSAISTSISYIIVQCLYFIDQHRYYNISMTKVGVLIITAFVFAIFQVFIGAGVLIRIIFCMITLISLVLLARNYSIVDRNLILRIFSGKMKVLGEFILHVTEPRTKGFTHV